MEVRLVWVSGGFSQLLMGHQSNYHCSSNLEKN